MEETRGRYLRWRTTLYQELYLADHIKQKVVVVVDVIHPVLVSFDVKARCLS